MTSPSEDCLRRAVDEMLTVCWNEDIPLLDALGEALDDWMALAAVEFDDAAARASPVEPGLFSTLRRDFDVAAARLPALRIERAIVDAIVGWVHAFTTSKSSID